MYRQLSPDEKGMTDSLISYALDHEALYTLCDTLKPVSSIRLYSLPLFSADFRQKDSAQQVLMNLQQLANKLSTGNFSFILNPFARKDSIYKMVELYVVRKSRLAEMIRRHAEFYGPIGISPASMPATVLALTENENKYDRWRSYGYLFGYPDYAVDFFVKAGREQDSTRQFVKRDFFQIPVYAANSGYFTYAIPKDYPTNATDSAIYIRAQQTLGIYRMERDKRKSPVYNWVRVLRKTD